MSRLNGFATPPGSSPNCWPRSPIHQADVVMGVAASSLALLDTNGMLYAYAPANLAAITPKYRDKKNPPAWWAWMWGCHDLLQHDRSGEEEPAKTGNLAGPDQTDLQGSDRDAESGFFGHGLL